ncbi:MAG: winged helix-turn-helix domain-containing protein [Salinivirgaceae bacterium]|jgi:hypothetical protein|nr:winged helix-turn-helix domain-containing protein [Salinivirgaceae bacterium]
MITEKNGTNAGKLWALLNEQGAHSFKDAKKKLKMTNPDLYMAMGWLCREEKVSISDDAEIVMDLK